MIKEGSKVSVHYTLTVEDAVVDSSNGQDPLSYTQGAGEIIPGLEAALAGLKEGDKKDVTIPPEKGYGSHSPEAIKKVPRESFQDADKLEVGSVVNGQVQGQNFRASVIALETDSVTLDLNHPLAGKTLNFQVEIVTVAS